MISIIPVEGLPEIRAGDDLGVLIAGAARLEDGDVVVVAQKAVSKAEGRVVRLDSLEPGADALRLAGGRDPRHTQAILDESVRIVRERDGFVIAETRHGFVCGSAGVDASNAPEEGTLVLLPLDPDASARRIRASLRTVADVGVIVSDSFGRPWRLGTTDVAIGVAGLRPLLDLQGRSDPAGYELHATVIAVGDEVAAAAQLASGKLDRVPVTIVRGLDLRGEAKAIDIAIPPELDLFR
jgi:coenzyme F420-0:L-glutamate ligase / coenzyme F420-1:gamma-L-glutamate ligase